MSGINKLRNQVNLDKTLTFTKSSYAYKDPYIVGANPYTQLLGRARSFMAIRNIENEFVDFKSYNLDMQFREINKSVYKAYQKNDKVNMQRSLSDSMNQYAVAMRAEKRQNPFLKEISRLQTLQSRMYSDNDHLLPEDQWAQITVFLRGVNSKDEAVTQYTVFERRVADKLDYFDWKISFMAEEEDFKFINDESV